MNEIKFPYKPNIAIFLLSSLVVAGIAVSLGYIAFTNEQGLIINKIIELSVEGATLFYWVVAIVTGLFSILAIAALVGSLITKKEIIILGNNIIAPKSGISKKLITINLEEVTDVNIQSVQKQKLLYIIHPNNKLVIPQSMLPSKQLFDELTELVVSKVNG